MRVEGSRRKPPRLASTKFTAIRIFIPIITRDTSLRGTLRIRDLIRLSAPLLKMAGRGRGATLPAWMTRPGGEAAPAAAGPTAPAASRQPDTAALARQIMSAANPSSQPLHQPSVYSTQHLQQSQAQQLSGRPSGFPGGAASLSGGSLGATPYGAAIPHATHQYGGISQPGAGRAAPLYAAGSVAAAPAPVAAAAPAAGVQWTAHTSPDGRAYYYNSATKESTFVKVSVVAGRGGRLWITSRPILRSPTR